MTLCAVWGAALRFTTEAAPWDRRLLFADCDGSFTVRERLTRLRGGEVAI